MRAFVLLIGTLLGVGSVLLGMRMGSDPVQGLKLATIFTARAAFIVFFVAFTASSLTRLVPNRLSRRIYKVRRWWGLSFALVHTFHLVAFVAYFKALGEPVPLAGAPVYLVIYTMVLTSTNAAQKRMGQNWKRLHKAGAYIIWATFTLVYVAKAVTGQSLPVSLPFAIMCIAAAALRWVAWQDKRKKLAMA
ncbi:MAG: hypothetical protein ACKOPO_09270 [Novosphingobium sp.]